MGNGSRMLSRAAIAFGTVCFFMPFLTVSCAGQKLITLSGTQLALGTIVQTPSFFGQSESKQIPAEPLLTVALLSGLGSIGASFFLKNKSRDVVPALLAAAASVLLLVFKSDNGGSSGPLAGLGPGAEYEFGFWLAFAS